MLAAQCNELSTIKVDNFKCEHRPLSAGSSCGGNLKTFLHVGAVLPEKLAPAVAVSATSIEPQKPKHISPLRNETDKRTIALQFEAISQPFRVDR
jgi:hypothetical protein